jgi:hypothetical protein
VTRLAVLVTAVSTLALLAGCGGGSDADSSQQASTGGAEIVSADFLRQTASEGTTPIYWAGERAGTKLELSRPDETRTYVRYLTDDAEAGDKRADFLAVSTYVQPHAASSLRRQGRRSGGTVARAPGGATVYYERENPRSVYLAYPSVPVEVEVFDPSFKRALRLVQSGAIAAVD